MAGEVDPSDSGSCWTPVMIEVRKEKGYTTNYLGMGKRAGNVGECELTRGIVFERSLLSSRCSEPKEVGSEDEV